MSQFINQENQIYEKALTAVIGAILINTGYTKSDTKLIDIINEMLQNLIVETGKLSINFAEHSGRTKPILPDILLSLIEMGMDVTTLPEYAVNDNKIRPPTIHHQVKPTEIRSLKSGIKDYFSYIPDYFPELPDRRTYSATSVRSIKTDKDAGDLEGEKALLEKHEIEKSYTHYLAKTGESLSLFEDNDYDDPLDEIKVILRLHESKEGSSMIPAYVPALLGKYSYGCFESQTATSNIHSKENQNYNNGFNIINNISKDKSCNLQTQSHVDSSVMISNLINSPLETYSYPLNDYYTSALSTDHCFDVKNGNDPGINNLNIAPRDGVELSMQQTSKNQSGTTDFNQMLGAVRKENRSLSRKAAILSALKMSEEKRRQKLVVQQASLSVSSDAQNFSQNDTEQNAFYKTESIKGLNDIVYANNNAAVDQPSTSTQYFERDTSPTAIPRSQLGSQPITGQENTRFIESLMQDNPYVRLYENRRMLSSLTHLQENKPP